MDPQQSSTPPSPVKKVLVKRVKVLVKRPVAAAPAAAPAPQNMVKVPVKHPVAAQPAQPTPAQPAPARHPFSAPRPEQIPSTEPERPQQSKQEARPLNYELPDDIVAAVEKYKKIPHKAFALYIYAYTYAKRVA